MTMFFSKTTGGFYSTDIHGETMPSDAVEISDAAYQALLAGQQAGQTIAFPDNGAPTLTSRPAPTLADVKASLEQAVQQHLDAQAQSMGYDSLLAAASYAEEPAVLKFQAEGRALRAWRSQVWAVCLAEVAALEASGAAPPTVNQLIASLPPFVPPTV